MDQYARARLNQKYAKAKANAAGKLVPASASAPASAPAAASGHAPARRTLATTASMSTTVTSKAWRMNRVSYAAALVALEMIAAATGVIWLAQGARLTTFLGLVAMAFMIPTAFRLRDMGQSPWYVIGLILPLVSHVVKLFCLCQPAMERKSDPKEQRWLPWLLVAWFFGLMLLSLACRELQLFMTLRRMGV